MNLGRYAKAVTGLVGTALTYATQLWGTGPDAKYIAIATGIATVLGIYAVPNSASSSSSAPPLAGSTASLGAQTVTLPAGATITPPGGSPIAVGQGATLTLPG